jgi:multicomponent Na+:H+ antiporter subunit B
MKKYIRHIIAIGLIITLMVLISNHVHNDEYSYNTLSKDYYIQRGLNETSSKNLVTAIYLDYRMFDSFFEASLLLIAVTGIAFMAIKDEDLL